MSSANEWPMVKLGEISEVVSGGTPKTSEPSFWDGGVPWITPADLGKNPGLTISEGEKFISQDGLKKSSAVLIPAGSVVLSSRAPIGHIATNTQPLATNQGCKSFVPSQELNASYLVHYLIHIRGHLQQMGTGATFKELSRARAQEIPVLLPPLAEQQRIAEILENGSQLVEQVSSKLSLLDELEKSSYLSLFSSESATTPTQDIAANHKDSMRTGPFGSQLKHAEFVDEGIAVLGLDNVVSNRFRWAEPRHITAEKYEQLKRYTVYPNDVLISIMGTTGRCVIVPDDIPTTINTKHICAITTDHTRMLPEFLRASFLWHPEVRQVLRQQTKGAIMSGLNMGIIKKLPLPLPEISRQKEWVNNARAIDSGRQELLKQYRQIQELSTTLQTRAFAGQL